MLSPLLLVSSKSIANNLIKQLVPQLEALPPGDSPMLSRVFVTLVIISDSLFEHCENQACGEMLETNTPITNASLQENLEAGGLTNTMP